MDEIPTQLYPLQTLTTHFSKISFNIGAITAPLYTMWLLSPVSVITKIIYARFLPLQIQKTGNLIKDYNAVN
jgi:hypothetical protein